MSNIDIRWHRFQELALRGDVQRVYHAEAGKILTRPVKQSPGFHQDNWSRLFGDFISRVNKMPYFVISNRLISSIYGKAETFSKGILDLQEAGLLHMPYKQMVIELEDMDAASTRSFVVMQELRENQFSTVKMSLVRDQQGEYAVWWPMRMVFGIHRNPEAMSWDKELILDMIMEGAMTLPGDKFDGPDDDLNICEAMKSTCATMLVFGAMLWRTRGMEKVTIEPPAALNKSRLRAGKPLIREYTLLRIGHVYDRSGVAHQSSDASIHPIHWRCGHRRNQAYGAGHKLHREIWIDPVLVNYVDEETTPKPKYRATL